MARGKGKSGNKPVTGNDNDNVIDVAGAVGTNKINGGDGNDSIVGSAQSDTVNAGDGDDFVTGGSGDDSLFGNDGFDTAIFSGSILDYTWEWAKGNTLNVSGADGNDELKHFEALQFDDFTYNTAGNNDPVGVLRSGVSTDENASPTGTFDVNVDIYDFDGDVISVDSVSISGGGSFTFATGAASQAAAMGSSTGLQISFTPGTDYDYLAEGEDTTEVITVEISDGNGGTQTLVYNLTITGTNDAPVAVADNADTHENGAITVDVLANDTDVDLSDTHTVDSVSVVSGGGIVSIVGNQVEWDPGTDYDYLAEGETATVEISYEMSDNNGATDSSTLTITVTGTNDAPVAQAVSAEVGENAPGATGFDATDGANTIANIGHWWIADYDTGTMTSVPRTTSTLNFEDVAPTNGVVLTLNPNAPSGINWGVAAMSFSDGVGSVVDPASIQVDGFAGTPVATGDFLSVDGTISDGTVSVTVTDVETPDGPATFDFTVSGVDNPAPGGASDTLHVDSVELTVTPQPAPGTVTVAAVFDDVDASDTHTFSVDATGTSGTVTNNGDGTFTYSTNGQFEYLAAGETATDTFTYTVDDGNGGTDTETVTVTINGENDAPVANHDMGAVTEDGPGIIIDLLANDSDLDLSDMLSIDSFDFAGLDGTVTDNGDGTITYDPNGAFEDLNDGEFAIDSFSYTVSDGNGGTSTATVDVRVDGITDASSSGLEDLVVVGYSSDYYDFDQNIGVLFNNGDGTYSAPDTYDSQIEYNYSYYYYNYDYTYNYAVAVGDVDGDGSADIVAGGQGYNYYSSASGDSLAVLLNQGDGTFGGASTMRSGLGYEYGASYSYEEVRVVDLVDMDGDGNLDIVAGGYGYDYDYYYNSEPGSLSILLGNGDGTFQSANKFETQPGTGYSSYYDYEYTYDLVTADFDGDGNLDVASAGYSDGYYGHSGAIAVLLGDGTGGLQQADTYSNNASYYYGYEYSHAIDAGDVNGDGYADIVTGNQSDSSYGSNSGVSLLLGNGDGTFQTGVSMFSGTGYDYYGNGDYYENVQAVELADIDGDGNLDIIAGGQHYPYYNNGGDLGILLGNGDGTFQGAISIDTNPGNYSSVRDMRVFDADGDGNLDVALLMNNGVELLLGNGDGTFQDAITYDDGISAGYGIAIGDLGDAVA